LASDVSDITEKVLAHGATLDATYQLAQDGMTSSKHIRTLVHDMSGAVNCIDGDVSLMKLEFEEMKVTLKEIRDAMTLVLAKLH
jgi:septation ring formation regulator EzrA